MRKLLLVTIIVVLLPAIALSSDIVVNKDELVFVNLNHYKNGINDIYVTSFVKGNRVIATREYTSGKLSKSIGEIPDGVVIELYDSGKINNFIIYKDGLRNGKTMSFYDNGRLKREGQYLNDNPIGEIKWYYQNGNLMRIDYFDEKGLYKKDLYDEKGEIYKTDYR